MISIIIPIFNEVDNIEPLWTQLIPQLKLLKQKFEVIFVNDGSRDGSEKILLNLAKKYKDCKVINNLIHDFISYYPSSITIIDTFLR
mgnify:CR=1 FL=1